MSSPKIIIADPDLNYLLKLQIRLLEGINGDAQIECITDEEYFKSYFAVPRDAGCLIVFEGFYSEDLLKHNIDNIVLLTESAKAEAADGGKVRCVEKYTTLNQVFNQIKAVLTSRIFIDQKKDVEVISFYSASGGMGKTVLSLSLAKYLGNRHYKVLYLNTESIQSMGFYLEDSTPLSNKTMINLETSSASAYGMLKSSIRKEGFSYLPEFPAPLAFYSIGKDLFTGIISEVCSLREYDYIIVDLDSIFDELVANILKISEKVFFITNQEEATTKTAERFLAEIDTRPGQYVFIYNNYLNDETNRTEQLDQVTVDQYMPHFYGKGRDLLERISSSDAMLKMALMLD